MILQVKRSRVRGHTSRIVLKINEFGQRKQTLIDEHATQTYDWRDPMQHALIVQQVELSGPIHYLTKMMVRIAALRQ